jgi:hypothetical protein
VLDILSTNRDAQSTGRDHGYSQNKDEENRRGERLKTNRDASRRIFLLDIEHP